MVEAGVQAIAAAGAGVAVEMVPITTVIAQL
jgi:hypothetical protein